MRTPLTLLTCLTLCLLIPACSSEPRPVKIAGKLTNNDKPLPASKGMVQVQFVPIVEKGAPQDTYPAKVNRDDMTFEVPGKKGDGIPPGKYRIAVQLMSPGAPAEVLEMNKRFGNDNSPITYEVVGENVSMVIDLGKATAK